MGDMADDLCTQELTYYYDHLAGHVAFPADGCPYCEEEDAQEEKGAQQASRVDPEAR